jgi:hypothetical protein
MEMESIQTTGVYHLPLAEGDVLNHMRPQLEAAGLKFIPMASRRVVGGGRWEGPTKRGGQVSLLITYGRVGLGGEQLSEDGTSIVYVGLGGPTKRKACETGATDERLHSTNEQVAFAQVARPCFFYPSTRPRVEVSSMSDRVAAPV